MEQVYLLKKHRGVSLFESAQMTAEDRKWWLERINKDIEEENKAAKGGGSSGMPSMPHVPRPSIPRPH